MIKLHFVGLFFLSVSYVGLASAQEYNKYEQVGAFWHSTLSSSLHLPGDQLKIVQLLREPIGETSYWLWSIFNAIPPSSGGYYYNPSQYNNFSSDYGLLLSEAEVSPAQAPCNINNAILQFINAHGQYSWNKTIDSLLTGLQKTPAISITADTTIAIDPSVCDSTKIIISATFSHFEVFYAYPCFTADTLIDTASLCNVWFTPCFLKEAYQNVDDSILTQQNWTNAFGTYGYMQNICRAIVIAEDGSIDISLSDSCTNFSTYTSFKKQPVLLAVLINTTGEFISSF